MKPDFDENKLDKTYPERASALDSMTPYDAPQNPDGPDPSIMMAVYMGPPDMQQFMLTYAGPQFFNDGPDGTAPFSADSCFPNGFANGQAFAPLHAGEGVPEEEAHWVCPGCGNRCALGSKFCNECGSRRPAEFDPKPEGEAQ